MATVMLRDSASIDLVIANEEVIRDLVKRLPAKSRSGATNLELLQVAGIDIVGPLPGDTEKIIVYKAGVPAEGADPVTAETLVKFLTSETAAQVLKQKGVEPD
jgi:ABC-type molybdate transport system substrate-binding protein